MDGGARLRHIGPMSSTLPATRCLAQWAATAPADWAPAPLAIAVHSLEDTLAAMVAGSGEAVCQSVRAAVAGSGGVPLVGDMRTASAAASALANGTAAHARELDEMFFVAGSHFGCAVVPAVLAVAHQQDAPLRAVLDALIVGSEVMACIGIAMGRSHFEKGWHGTQTLGVLAAAAACGRLLHLDAARMTHAISLAVSMAAGPKVQFGSDAKPVHAGLAAQGGVLAATLAAAGVTGDMQALEGPHGFGALYAGTAAPDWSALLSIGDGPLAIESHGLAFKLYPNCASTHRCLDALRALREAHGFTAADVAHVETLVGRVNMANLRYPEPGNAREAMFSMQYAVAVMLRRGALTLDDFTPAAVADPETRALLHLTELRLDPRAERGMESTTQLLPHTTVVTLKNGRRHALELRDARGSLRNPMSAAERRAKFAQCTHGVVPADQLTALQDILQAPQDAFTRRLLALLRFDAATDSQERTSP